MDSGDPDWAVAQIGRVLGGRWRLERPLGVGGTAVVFEAAHRNGKRVAIKVLRPERSSDAAVRRRFLSEGYAANQVGHPAVVEIHDDGEEADGTAFLVMELLAGTSLDRLAQRHGGQLPWRMAADLTLELLDVLASSHRRGITHRDVKPANLWWTDRGTLRVLDFGLARFTDSRTPDHQNTRDGALLGTPAFMAPEQARATPDGAGPLSDIWAVGATGFALLTGRQVYEAPTVDEQLALAAACPAPSLVEHAPDVPAGVAAVFQRALEHDARRRWQSADAMREALSAALDGDEVRAFASETAPSDDTTFLKTVPEGGSASRSPSRALHPLVLPAVGLGVVLTLGGGLLASLRGGTAPPATSLAAARGTQAGTQPSTPTSTFSRTGLAGPAVLPTPSPAPRASSAEPVSSAKRRRSVRRDASAAAHGEVPEPSAPRGLIEEPPF